jgi:hypothetical protein
MGEEDVSYPQDEQCGEAAHEISTRPAQEVRASAGIGCAPRLRQWQAIPGWRAWDFGDGLGEVVGVTFLKKIYVYLEIKSDLHRLLKKYSCVAFSSTLQNNPRTWPTATTTIRQDIPSTPGSRCTNKKQRSMLQQNEIL